MKERRIIGVITANTEGIYQQRILRGIFSQCRLYGYDAAVFAPLVKLDMLYGEYQEGEKNIFELINFELLDGIIVPSITIEEGESKKVPGELLDKFKRECTKPVIAIDAPFGDYPVIHTDDRSAFSAITEHILDVHGCKNIYFLSGMKDYAVSEERAAGFADTLKKRGIPLTEDHIIYGDFWYTSGEALAERIVSGEISPDAVICASDHMAIGLANRLIERGINVPEQIIVTGYDGTSEAVINVPTITTYTPDVSKASAEAVNAIRRIIEPEEEILPADANDYGGLRICSSCGCPEDVSYVKEKLYGSLMRENHNYSEKNAQDRVDIGKLLESYMFENFADSENVQDCLEKITRFDYLIRPYDFFYLCLTEGWLNTDERTEKGYPDKMRTAIFTYPQDTRANGLPERFARCDAKDAFDTKIMLPRMWESRSEPCVFYFSPVHNVKETLGYAVVQCSLECDHIVGYVYRNWLRNVNNALEMIRVNNRLMMFSERDAMTGLYNRRGLDIEFKRLKKRAKSTDCFLVIVIDMDGLKYINDTFGHSEGDYGINAIAAAARQISKNDELCIRAGGDEFYIIGVGDYNEIDALVRVQQLNAVIDETNKKTGKPYELSASVGYCCESITAAMSVDDLLHIADGRMYENKLARKKQRR